MASGPILPPLGSPWSQCTSDGHALLRATTAPASMQDASAAIAQGFLNSVREAQGKQGNPHASLPAISSIMLLARNKTYGDTPCLSVVRNGHVPDMDNFKFGKADLCARNKLGESAFAIAAREGNLPMLEYFISRGVFNINQGSTSRDNAALAAIEANQADALMYLVKNEAVVPQPITSKPLKS